MRSLLRRFTRAVVEEFINLKPRLILADLLVAVLPRLCFCRVRTAIYRLAGVEIGPRTSVLGRLTLAGTGAVQRRLHIGSDCIINAPLFLDLSAEVRIGNCVSIGHHSVFVTTHHEIGSPDYRSGMTIRRPILIGDGSWIHHRAVQRRGEWISSG
jgi:maltose O-acetyltransferase